MMVSAIHKRYKRSSKALLLFDDSSDSSEDEFQENMKALAFIVASNGCQNREVRQHIVWDPFANQLVHENMFRLDHRMSRSSFDKLIGILGNSISINPIKSSNNSGERPISEGIVLHCTLWYLAGGSYLDIRKVVGISKSSFYRCVSKGINAIVNCEALKMHFPANHKEYVEASNKFNLLSLHGAMHGCIGVIDGWLCPIKAPSVDECGNVNAFFSGHYQTYGLNVQAVCNYKCQFVYACCQNPGSSSDIRAYNACALKPVVDDLPPGFYIGGDNAYPESEHLLTPFAGDNAKIPINDTFNFYISQLRIKIEQAFGFMVSRWRILKTPLSVKLEKVPSIVLSCMLLHNYIMEENDTMTLKLDANDIMTENGLGYYNTCEEEQDVSIVSIQGGSQLRKSICNFLESNNYKRPEYNLQRNRDIRK